MNMRLQNLFALVLALLLTGCATLGSLKSDRIELNEAFYPKVVTANLYVEFKSLPGVISETTYTQFTSNTSSFDADLIVIEVAREVFALKFPNVVIGHPPRNNSEPHYKITVNAKANANKYNGAHVSYLEIKLVDENSDLIIELKEEQTVYDLMYAQPKPMKRAFYRSYHSVLRKIDEVI